MQRIKNVITFLLTGFTLVTCSQIKGSGYSSIVYSSAVRDSFELYISTPPGHDTNQKLSVFYYFDANLKSGKKLREMISRPEYTARVNNTIFVGIGHIGDFHVLRRRDFILPEINNGDTAGISRNYGQTENFYRFLTTEVIPMINSRYKTDPKNNSIMGHSLGGLFVFYCLFKNDTIFRNYYALSPSLWVDNYSIYKFNNLSTNNSFKRDLYFSVGSMEIFNHIKTGAKEMNDFLQMKNYPKLSYAYQVHNGETHNSQVEHSLDYLLKQK